MTSASQIAANQANAQKSSGPVTAQGKAVVAKNALKTGLTGRTVLLPSDDAELYAAHILELKERFKPETSEETELVQSIADTAWRLARIPSLEAGIYAVGRAKLATLHAGVEDEAQRKILVEAEVHLAYERQLKNLHIQEGRLRKHLAADTAALTNLQETRRKEARAKLHKAALLYKAAWFRNEEFNPAENGFEFSNEQLHTYLHNMYPTLHMPSWSETL